MKLPALYLPTWADELGEDRFGVFARFMMEEVRFTFRWIPAGVFLMGSPDDELGRWDEEGPQHKVRITQGFWLGETPVTKAQWHAVLGRPSEGPGGAEHPATEFDWYAATAFAEALGQHRPGLGPRLPTEAEWEYACRAGTTTAFSNGLGCTAPEGTDPALEKIGWYVKNSGGGLQPVRLKQANPWGLYDMHGNVWEWCLDGLRTYSEAAVGNLVGPHDSPKRAVRGGSWFDGARACRSAYRSGGVRGGASGFLGLRLAAGQEPPEASSQGSSPASPAIPANPSGASGQGTGGPHSVVV